MIEQPQIAVILGTPGVRWKDTGSPFAHLVALSDGEVVSAKARQTVHVFSADDGGFDFADGVLALEDECAIIGSLFSWPILVAALLLPVKAFSGLTNTRPNQPPHQRLKNLSEDGYSSFAGPDGEAGYAATALEASTRWNEWNREEVTMAERAREICGAERWAAKPETWISSRVEVFGKLCRNVGMRFGEDVHDDVPWKEVRVRLAAAKELFEGLQQTLRQERRI